MHRQDHTACSEEHCEHLSIANAAPAKEANATTPLTQAKKPMHWGLNLGISREWIYQALKILGHSHLPLRSGMYSPGTKPQAASRICTVSKLEGWPRIGNWSNKGVAWLQFKSKSSAAEQASSSRPSPRIASAGRVGVDGWLLGANRQSCGFRNTSCCWLAHTFVRPEAFPASVKIDVVEGPHGHCHLCVEACMYVLCASSFTTAPTTRRQS